MEDLYLQDIFVYPIKSLGGIRLEKAEVQQTGLQYDRRWMLVDESGKFMSQRSLAQMALLQVDIARDGLVVNHKKGLLKPLFIPFDKQPGKEVTVSIWEDVCTALEVNLEANKWFSEALNMPVSLVYMPSATRRTVDPNYALNNEVVSFADAFPLLLVGQQSLDDLNMRLVTPVPMNRFRPNFVFAGGTPFCEDSFTTFRLGEVGFSAVKPCARCVLTTVNQDDGIRGDEPLKTLAGFRTFNNKVLFGQNLLQHNTGTIKISQKLEFFSGSN